MATSYDACEVLDDNGHETGQILDRATVHKKELWHSVVNVWILNSKNELLMQLRAPGVELSPNTWDVSIGTHLRVGESPMDAAIRCCSTELAVAILPDQLEHLFNVQCANPMTNGTVHKVMGHVFLVKRDLELNEFTFDPAKITQLAWIPLPVLVSEIGNQETRSKYFPRASNYYAQLFEAFQAWM